ncbi:MAG: hypothetical protein COA49_09810 [Bacteroidetes bacterium]|nr:MAG: hypothetical protein COA49_09810 [Bacteroidota bacterium]
MNKVITMALILLNSQITHAQVWLPLDDGLNNKVADLLLLDNDNLFITGDFSADGDGKILNGIAVWDGSAFNTLSGSQALTTENVKLYAYEPVLINDSICFVYDNHLFGSYVTVPGEASEIYTPPTFTLEGQELYFEKPTVVCYNGNLFSILSLPLEAQTLGEVNGQLIIGVKPIEAGNPIAYSWDGSELDSLILSGSFAGQFSTGGRVHQIDEYNGFPLFVGKIGTSPISPVFYWGENGEPVGLSNDFPTSSEVSNENMSILAVEWFNNNLYISTARFIDSTPRHLFKLVDGNWVSVIDDLFGKIEAMMSTDNFLYVTGRIGHINGVDCTVSRWDGTNWECVSDVGIRSFDLIYHGSEVDDLIVFQNELIISGEIADANGLRVMNICRLYSGPELITEDEGDEFLDQDENH